MRTLLMCLSLLLCAHVALLAPEARADDLTVFAAASLTDAMRDIGTAWQQAGHPGLRQSFASSSTLARQIEQGAPANVFASADEKWMAYLADRGLIVPDTRKDLLGNELVLIVPASHPVHVTIDRNFNLGALLGPDGRLALGDPAHVPAGIYAKQALTKLGLWDKIGSRVAGAADVRGALLLVQRGETPAGIVYATDAAASDGVVVAGVFPDDSHDPIVYPFAVVKSGDTPQARALLQFLAGPEARGIFVKYGFKAE